MQTVIMKGKMKVNIFNYKEAIKQAINQYQVEKATN